MRRVALSLVLLLAFWGSAQAEELRGPQPDALLGGLVKERDVALVFDYLREAISGAVEGRNVTPPAELTGRAEAIGEEVKRRAAAAARAIVDEIESLVRESVRGEPRRNRALTPDRNRL